MRFIFYLRSIEKMSYLVRMLVEVILDMRMRAFLIVLAIAVIGFADAFLSIKEATVLYAKS